MTKPVPLTCKQTVEHLSDFVDRELSPDEAAQVEVHLARCADCAQEFQFEETVLTRLKATLRRVKAPPGLLDRIRALLG
jgi:anti-sigma factor (TIGR02949 family)